MGVTQRILAYCLFGLTTLLMTMGGASYAVIAYLEAQQINATLNTLKLHTQAQFALLDNIIQQEELSLQPDWQNKLAVIFQQLEPDPFATSPKTLNQIARDLRVDAVYLINRDAQIIVGSISQERDLNLGMVSNSLGDKLKQNVGSGMQINHHLGVSLRTGQLMLFHYYAPKGKNYWFETALVLKPFLQQQQVLSERYPLFKAWFKADAIGALPVSNIDILLQRDSGNYSIFTERVVEPKLARMSATSNTAIQSSDGRYYVALALGENMHFTNAVLAVDLDTAAFDMAQKIVLVLLLLLWVIGMVLTTWWLRRSRQQMMDTALHILKQYTVEQLPKAGLDACWLPLQQYALAQQREQSELARLQRVERSEMAYAQQQKTQSLEAEIARRRESEATLAELRLGLEMANRRLIEANTSLIHEAETDLLTSCGNRRMFEQTAATEIARAIRYAHPACLLMLDIDFFKRVNDEFGHPMGDQVLIYLVDLLHKQIRPSDGLFRWGGEEFALLVPGVSLEQGRILAEKLRQSVADAVFPHQSPLSISIGVALLASDTLVEEWVQRADTALYSAKSNGRNRVELAP